MSPSQPASNNNDGKVTLALIGQKVDNLTNIVERMDGRVSKIETTVCTEVQINKAAITRLVHDVDEHDSEIDSLKNKTSWWNGVNSAGAILAGILGALGLNK